jgi:type III pantothenate kinase
MLFVVDVGNSHTVVGLFEGKKLLGHWRLKSDAERTADELAIRYHSLFSMVGIDRSDITGVIIASVVPSLEAAWFSCCEKHFSQNLHHPPFIVSSANLENMVTIDTQYPEEVGADRLVNAIAAWHQYKSHLIVIDFGTAITFDCITADCTYVGGSILPGIAISLKALISNAAKLPPIDLTTPPTSVIGKNTIQAMKSGILYGYGAMIDGLVTKLIKEIGTDKAEVQTLSTGGMARLITPYSESVNDIDTMITLKGLQIIFSHFHDQQ